MKTILYLICYCIYPFSFLVPRTKKKIAFGSFRGAFNDNAKYLFIYAVEHGFAKNVCWLSNNRKTIQLIKSLGLPAKWVLSPGGVWWALRSKTWFVNSYTSDIMYCLSGNADVVNLWHGVGLKKCEFNVTSGALAKRYIERQFKEVFYHPEVFRRPDWFISSTDFQSQMFASAFRLPIEKCLNLGYPRNSMLVKNNEDIKQFISRYESPNTLNLIEQLAQYRKVYIYMPTWRDSQLNVFSQQFDFNHLESILAQQNAFLLLKPHANTKVDNIRETNHIRFIDGKTDVYGILPFTDVLITDYSSILYDYILMKNKDVILYLYDMDDYIKDRDFFYPFDENVVGCRAYNFDDLLGLITNENYTIDSKERERIITKFWGDTMNTDVCKNILDKVL